MKTDGNREADAAEIFSAATSSACRARCRPCTTKATRNHAPPGLHVPLTVWEEYVELVAKPAPVNKGSRRKDPLFNQAE